jgi:hypothetical protein
MSGSPWKPVGKMDVWKPAGKMDVWKPGQLRRNPGLSRPKEPPGVIDQLDIASQREARHHPFT